MNNKFFDKKLSRIIGQIKYRPTISTFDNTAILASGLEDKFEEWAAPKHDDISLYSPSEKKYLQITFDTVTYLSEGEQNTEELYEYIKSVFSKSIEQLSVKQIRRVGFRFTQIFETEFEFPELVDLVYRKFYLQGGEFSKISSDKPRDTVFILDGQKNGYLNHVQIGPVTRDEAVKYFNASFEDKVLNSNISDTNLFVDIDVFVNSELTIENTLDKLQSAINENLRITNEYLEYITKK